MSLVSLIDVNNIKSDSLGNSLRVYDLWVDGTIHGGGGGGGVTPTALASAINNSRVETPGNGNLNVYGMRYGEAGDSEIVVGLGANEIYIKDNTFDNTIVCNVGGVSIESGAANVDINADQLVNIKGSATSGDTIVIGDTSDNEFRTNASGGIFITSGLNIEMNVPQTSPTTSYSQSTTDIELDAGNPSFKGASVVLDEGGILQLKSLDQGLNTNIVSLDLNSTINGGQANFTVNDTGNDEISEVFLNTNTARLSNYSNSSVKYSFEVTNEQHFIRNLDLDLSPTIHHIVYYDQFSGSANGQIFHALPPSTVSNVTLVGNPIHQFVTGGDGALDFRGMISPDGSVNFNVTATNIELTSPNQTITLTSDVTGSGTGSFATTIANSAVSTAKIANAAVTSSKIGTSAVTYPKIQNVTASSLLGNPTGSAAAPSEITLGTNLSFAGSVLNAVGGSGVTTTNVQNFSTGGYTYTPTAGMKFCQVVAQGGGGGGGGCRAGLAGTSGASAGGSSGATVLGFYNAATIGVSQSGIVGNGGAGGLGISGSAGNDGIDTTFGALITAAKGRGGAGITASASFTSTSSTSTFGTSSGGTIRLEGSYGLAGHAHGSNLAPIAGAGGASTYFGDGGFGFGSGSGAGGGGVSTSGAVADVDGFAGKSGRLFVIEYI